MYGCLLSATEKKIIVTFYLTLFYTFFIDLFLQVYFRLAAIDSDDGYTGVKPQHRYVTYPPWHRPSPSLRFYLL